MFVLTLIVLFTSSSVTTTYLQNARNAPSNNILHASTIESSSTLKLLENLSNLIPVFSQSMEFLRARSSRTVTFCVPSVEFLFREE